jgi:glycosyltransferase involved in cell wall biosynthesis
MSARRKRILVLAPRLPYPQIGGDRLRLYGLCQVLARQFDLSLLSLCENQEEMDLPLPDDGIFRRIQRVWLPKKQSYLNCLRALPSRLPLQIAYYRSPEFSRLIRELMPEHDMVLAHLIRTGDYVRHLDCPKVLELTDAMALKYERVEHARANLGTMSMIYRIDARRLKNYEKSIIADFDISVVVSDVDKAFLVEGGEVDGGRLLLCSNGVDTKELPYRFAPDGSTIVFIANMTSLQNLDAAWHFVSDILPRVRAALPQAVFRIVGRIDQADAEEFRAVDGVQVTGQVESIPAAAAGAGVGVCPIRFGAGVQNKVLEYMALGIPVVSSSIGHEGLGAVSGEHLVVADSAAEVAAACVRLLTEREVAERLALAARRYVEAEHNWAEVLAPLTQRISAMLPE